MRKSSIGRRVLSSQDFMKNLIDLVSYTGIHYDQVNFYFDQANAVMEELLKEK